MKDQAAPEKINILMVDDRPENLLALESLLDSPDLNLVQALSGNEALREVLRLPFALVLLDVQMPEMDGFECAELMRMNPKTRNIPIIFLTALSREQKYVFRGYETGAVDYIAKPIEPMILKSKVEVFCQLYRQHMELEASRHELQEANRELLERKAQLEAELDLARNVQLGFLPKEYPGGQVVCFSQHFSTCDQLGGDLFDVFTIDDNRFGFFIADVSGHGVCAALLSGLLKMAVGSFRAQLLGGTPADADSCELLQPGLLLQKVNAMLSEQLQPDRFISMIYGVADLDNKEMRIASAGHHYPIIYKTDTSQAESWRCDNGPAIGFLFDIEYEVNTRKLETGDKVLLYTDGIIETMNAESDEYGLERLTEHYQKHGHESVESIITHIESDVNAFRDGAPIQDDQTLLLMHIR